MSITVACVPPHMFNALLHHCGDMVQRGLALAGAVGDVGKRVESADMQVWLVTDGRSCLATCFTDIHVEDDGGRFVAVFGLAGHGVMKWGRQLSDTLAQFARDEGARRVMFAGRPGWAKVLPDFKPVERVGGEYVWERRVTS